MSDPTPPRAPADRGSAMVITLMVLALVTALSTTVAVVTINNLQASMRAQQAGAALNAADSGIAQAMAHVRNTGVRDLDCTVAAPTAPACARPWGSRNPTRVSMSAATGQSYEVWIEAVTPFPNPTNVPGVYRIHSVGRASGEASREVVTDLTVSAQGVPKGIFARTLSGGGSASVARESIFSTGCVYQRSKIAMVNGQLDAAYGIPIGVHSSQVITDANGSGQYCSPDRRSIHRDRDAERPCNPDYPYDQDRLGGSLAGTACQSATSLYSKFYGARDLDGVAGNDVDGSFIKDDATLFELFGISDPALSPTQIDQYRTIAQSQGNYWTSATGWTSPKPEEEPNAVMFFDLTAPGVLGATVDLNDITTFRRPANVGAGDANCTSKSLLIVIEGGNAKLNAGQQLAASLFLTGIAPNGQVRSNGNSSFIGTVYANNINLVGNTEFSLDPCFLDNVPPALLELSTGNYRELDR